MIDSDQHISEPPTMWADHIDPADRDRALGMATDELGYTWITWQGARLGLVDVQTPGDTRRLGEHRQRQRQGEPSTYRYDDELPAEHWDPTARVAWLDAQAIDQAVCFPNFGLLWERRLSADLRSLTANMRAWNRYAATLATDGKGRLHPVGHLTLRDPDWAVQEIAALAKAGIKLAMIAPAPVDGKALSHPDHEVLWRAFAEHGVSPVFHVADQPRVFDDCWYGEDGGIQATEAVFLWVPPALALTDLILHGVLERHPDLRLGVVELSAVWVPMWLMMLDGGSDFTAKLNGQPVAPLARRPSQYFFDQVRVSCFSYELPGRLIKQSGDIYMACSDFPHSEGTRTPVADYRAVRCELDEQPGLASENVKQLLRV